MAARNAFLLPKSESLVEAAERRWPVRHGPRGNAETRLWMQYLGALALLGRVMRHLPEGSEDYDCATEAFIDANILMRERGSTMRYERASGRQVAAFEDTQMNFLRPMSEAPRDGTSIMARLKPARTAALESKRKTRDRKVSWKDGRWLDRTVAGCYWLDEAFEGWRR